MENQERRLLVQCELRLATFPHFRVELLTSRNIQQEEHQGPRVRLERGVHQRPPRLESGSAVRETPGHLKQTRLQEKTLRVQG